VRRLRWDFGSSKTLPADPVQPPPGAQRPGIEVDVVHRSANASDWRSPTAKVSVHQAASRCCCTV
jgi:hypothetical protein